jgi:sulfate transport system permease protein
VIPGRGLSVGLTLFAVTLVVLLPIAAIVAGLHGMSLAAFVQAVTSPRVLAAYRLTFGASLVAATTDAVLGFLIAWATVRYTFAGRAILNGCIDVPFALPTPVAGIALATLYADNGWIGALTSRFGVHVAFTSAGVTVALIFVGIPFVVRTLQPAIEAIPADLEETSSLLGASGLQTLVRVIVPLLAPAWLAGFAMAFARGLGEYGSVIFIAGNRPGVTEIVPLVIVTKLEEYDYPGATALAVTMLVASFVLLLAINALRRHIVGRQVAL